MSELDTLRIVGEALALVGAVLTGVLWLGRRVLHVLQAVEDVGRKQDATNEHLAKLNGKVATHDVSITEHEKSIAYLKGKEDARMEMTGGHPQL